MYEASPEPGKMPKPLLDYRQLPDKVVHPKASKDKALKRVRYQPPSTGLDWSFGAVTTVGSSGRTFSREWSNHGRARPHCRCGQVEGVLGSA